MRIRHFLYNAFIVEDLDIKLAIDPGQNLSLFKQKNLIPKSEWKGVTHVAVTHGDPDHFVFAIPMAKERAMLRLYVVKPSLTISRPKIWKKSTP